MGKAVDALETAMIAVHDDCTKFLDEKFMNSIFSEISEDRGPLDPLVELTEENHITANLRTKMDMLNSMKLFSTTGVPEMVVHTETDKAIPEEEILHTRE